MTIRKTVHFTGMDGAEQQALNDLFQAANQSLGGGWHIDNESDAGVLVVDVDSIYGHMTWLKVHNSGRTIVALTSHSEADADHVLARPVSAEAITELLRSIESGTGRKPARKKAENTATPSTAAAEPAPVSKPAPAPVPPKASEADTKAPEPQPESTSIPTPEPEPAPPPRDPMLIDYLAAGALPGAVKLSMDGAPTLILDPQQQVYIGPQALKGFLPYCDRVIQRDDWTAISPGELEKARADGGSQPYVRLRFLCGLAMGGGELVDGFSADDKYKLLKWPQIEREYPKHFRIATVMMKGPQTPAEITEASGASASEVADFINAYLAAGIAEVDVPPVETEAAPAPKGFLGRLRGR
ncbi:MAG: hypothetical protein R3F22_11055 [Lysobacteraceae bacterium]